MLINLKIITGKKIYPELIWHKIYKVSHKIIFHSTQLLFTAQALLPNSGTRIHRGLVKKYRLAMAKQLSIRRLPVTFCPISRGPPPWPRQPASCPALLLTRCIFTEKLTLPGTEAPLHQGTGLPSHRLTAALRPSCSTGGL